MSDTFPHTVLQVTPTLNAGGAERTTLEVAAALTSAGGRAVVASRGGRWEREMGRAGAELVRLPMDSKNPLVMARNIARLRAVIATRAVEIVHARSRAPAWSALAAARAERTPFVTTYHGVYAATSALKRFYNSVMARGDLVIANSHFTRAHVLAEHGVKPERVVTIYRGVDLDAFDPGKVSAERITRLRGQWSRGAEDVRPVILLPARLSRWKGHSLLLQAFARLAAQRPGSAQLVFAGAAQDSAYPTELAQEARGLGLGGAVSMVGDVEDMPAAMRLATLAVFPSLRPEAFGRGAVEAQAMGLPVVAADHGGLAETVVHGETGLLFRPGDVEGLASALQQLLDMDAQSRAAMGARGRARAQEVFSIERLKHATLNVYRAVLDREQP
jgi:glycosyltransferase involved in cell wall biosynthesis